MKNVEVELKLIAPDVAALNEAREALVGLCDRVRLHARQKISDTYIDTPDWRLLKAGYACRVRKVRSKYVLTMKSLDIPKQGVSRREELEQEVAGPLRRVLRDIPTGKAGSRLRRLCGKQIPGALFVVHNNRKIYEARLDALTAHVCLDDFEIRAGSRRKRFAEVEIEIIKGEEFALRRLGSQLLKRTRLTRHSRSKFAEGLKLAGRKAQ